MRRATVMVIITLVLIAAAPAPKEITEKLQGNWVVEKQESEGKDASEPDISMSLRIKGNTLTWTKIYTIKNSTSIVEYAYTVDPKKDPPEMDLVQNLPGGVKGFVILSIFSLDGDKLKICEGPPDGKRPKKFATDKDSDNYLLILKRKKD